MDRQSDGKTAWFIAKALNKNFDLEMPVELEKHQFLDYLHDRKSSMACPCCREEAWHMLIYDVDDITNQKLMRFSLWHTDVTKATSIAVDAVVMICIRCGFIRMHSIRKIEDDLDSSSKLVNGEH